MVNVLLAYVTERTDIQNLDISIKRENLWDKDFPGGNEGILFLFSSHGSQNYKGNILLIFIPKAKACGHLNERFALVLLFCSLAFSRRVFQNTEERVLFLWKFLPSLTLEKHSKAKYKQVQLLFKMGNYTPYYSDQVSPVLSKCFSNGCWKSF